MDVIEINAITGEVTERDYTADELAQRKTDAANAKDQAKIKEDADSQRVATITASLDQTLDEFVSPVVDEFVSPVVES